MPPMNTQAISPSPRRSTLRLWFCLALVLFGIPAARSQQAPTVEEFEKLKKEVEALRQEISRTRGEAEPPKEPSVNIHGVAVNLGGQYRVMGNFSNFGWHPASVGEHEDSRGFFNQRFRTWLSIAPRENIEGYLQMEVGHIMWGENFEWTKTSGGPRFPASTDPTGDRVGIKLRRGYLRYSTDNIGTFRVGIQDWHDAFGESPTLGTFRAVDDYDSFGAVLANSIWDFNVGGVSYVRQFPTLADMTLNLGGFVLWEGDTAKADDTYLLAMDADFPVKEKHSVGFSVYYLRDGELYSYPTVGSYRSSWDLWAGVRGKVTLGSVPLRAFVILNRGERKNVGGVADFEHLGWAAKLEAGGYPLGPGKLSAQFLFSTGDEDPTDNRSGEFRTIAQSERDNFGSQGYWSYLALTSPHGPSDVNDLGVGLQNRGLGLITVQAKYEYPLFKTLSGTVAAGWLRSAEDNPANGKNDMGVEVANTFTLNLGGGLSLDFGGAYLFTGDFYQAAGAGAGRPRDLGELFCRMQLEF